MALTYEEALRHFQAFGETDVDYLRQHFHRFVVTRQLYDQTQFGQSRRRVLDVGAHWLHQSHLWARDGHAVTAMDLSLTFDRESVRRAAEADGIRLLHCDDLENARALDAFPDDAFDVLLFTEIIAHITFNPRRMWRQLYRVLAPGACIIITTPNYYALRGRAWRPWRFLRGMGGGIGIDDVLDMPTYAHHWREYSRRELVRYFERLSADFRLRRVCHPDWFDGIQRHRVVQQLERWLPRLRPNLYLEFELTGKVDPVASLPGD